MAWKIWQRTCFKVKVSEGAELIPKKKGVISSETNLTGRRIEKIDAWITWKAEVID